MRLKVFLFFLLTGFVFPSLSFAQGKVEYQQDARLNKLVDKHVELNKVNKGIPGFRVQIFFDSGNNSKGRANGAKAKFMARYPDVPAYVIFSTPNYKVRVGDFRDRINAHGFLLEIQAEYPQAFIVQDEIEYPPLD